MVKHSPSWISNARLVIFCVITIMGLEWEKKETERENGEYEYNMLNYIYFHLQED